MARAEGNLVESRRVAFERMAIAREWTVLHSAKPEDVERQQLRFVPMGAGGLPVEEYAAAELGLALAMQPLTARRLMADAVDIESRLPHVWATIRHGQIEVWVARKIAQMASELRLTDALAVDSALADLVATLPPGRLLTLAEARVVEADQELANRKSEQVAKQRGVWLGRDTVAGSRALFAQGDAVDISRFYGTVDHIAHLLRDHCPDLIAETTDRLRARALGLLANPVVALKLMIGAEEHDLPEVVADAISSVGPSKIRSRAVAYVHFSPEALAGHGVVRAEELGAMTRRQLLELLRHDHVTLKPVIDLDEGAAADCYEVPRAISERLHLLRPADCFPFGSCLTRRQDQDHTVPFRDTGPPGQTRLGNLGHLTRHHHRIKTHAGWQVSQVAGRFTWITPHGRVYVTDARGTHRAAITPYESGLERRLAKVAFATPA